MWYAIAAILFIAYLASRVPSQGTYAGYTANIKGLQFSGYAHVTPLASGPVSIYGGNGGL